MIPRDALEPVTFLRPVGGRTFQNPVKIERGRVRADQVTMVNPDPYVLTFRGEYYCYSSGTTSVSVLRSRDLVRWDYRGEALVEPGCWSYWAPCVVYHNGLFYMYYSSMAEGITDDHAHLLKVAVADRPEGPFVVRKMLSDTFTIDAHVVRRRDGNWYLFYATNSWAGTDDERPGTVILVDRLVDFFTPLGDPRLAVRPTIDGEVFAKNRFGDGRDWHTVEGPFWLDTPWAEYLFYSGNAFTHEEYFLGYATSQDGLRWAKHPANSEDTPLLQRNGVVEGTGHNSVTVAPNNVDAWVVYHGRQAADRSDPTSERRTMRIDPLFRRGDELWIPGPSSEAADAPALPSFVDHCDNTETFEERWERKGGAWKISEGSLLQDGLSDIAVATSLRGLKNYRFQVSVRWERSHLGGRFGVFAAYQSPLDNVRLVFNVGSRRIVLSEMRNGVVGMEATAELERGFNFAAWHTCSIDRTGGFFRVSIDDVQLLSVRCSNEAGAGIGLFTCYTRASFDGIAVTEHLALEPGTETEFLRLLSVEPITAAGSWSVRDSAFVCRSPGGGEPSTLWLSDVGMNDYRMRVDVIRETRADVAGLYPLKIDDATSVKITLQADRVEVNVRVRGTQSVRKTMEFPVGFSNASRHTIDFLRHQDHVRLLVDNFLLYQGPFPAHGGKCGFLGSGCARFDRFSITGIG